MKLTLIDMELKTKQLTTEQLSLINYLEIYEKDKDRDIIKHMNS